MLRNLNFRCQQPKSKENIHEFTVMNGTDMIPSTNKRRMKTFPVIEPLPNSIDKENVMHNTQRNHPQSSMLPKQQNMSFSTLPPFRLSKQQSPSTSCQRRGVLRYGETIESLFHVQELGNEAYTDLCNAIVNGSESDDPCAWNRALAIATSSFSKNRVTDLIRLHRRATSRFSGQHDHPAVLSIWISYATILFNSGSLKDARLTMKHVQNQKLGEKQSLFYLKYAEFENLAGNASDAKQIIREGIRKGAQPLEELKDALRRLERGTETNEFILREQESTPKRRKTTKGVIEVNRTPNEDDIKLMETDNCSSMSLGTEGSSFTASDLNESKDLIIASNLLPRSTENASLGEVRRIDQVEIENEIERERRMNAIDLNSSIAVNASQTHPKITTFVDAAREQPSSVNHTFRTPLIQIKSVRVSGVSKTNIPNSKRPPLLSRTPRLTPLAQTGLGKPARIDPSQTVDLESDSDVDKEDASPLKKPIATKRTIPKLDLSYMWEWDPTRPRNSATDQTKDSKSGKPLRRIDEGSPSVSSSVDSLSGGGTKSSGSYTSHSIRSESDNCARESTHGTPSQAKSQLVDASWSTLNKDFLPLMSENNMVRVNNVSYAKLGVIGKGGSCKVYRALSKDCSVLAIKKVKLEGKERKAIEGYSNEIALLKRLRGNPSIIQLFDYEVDLNRQALFLVMELGEVDLNHVLQQQSLVIGNPREGKKRHLNMNFIRLTWQQMLSAVHSIHEERIIHGDLKPANFLFVRGALKLIDFGIAKAIQNDDTTNIYRESQIGTLNYMSPEAILDTGTGTDGARMKIGRASDIWSLGCILYQMIYGRPPFADLHMIQKLQAIVNPSYEIKFAENVDIGAIDAIKQCLRRIPEERPPIVGPGGLLNEHKFLNSG